MHKLTEALSHALELESALTGKPAPKSLKEQLKLWGAGICRIVVVGEIKRGKSTFINAMLGHEDLLPTGNLITTSTVYKVHYSTQTSYRVRLFNADGSKETVSVTEREQVEAYGSVGLSHHDTAEVEYISAGCDAELLKSGVVLIDTPGLGGIYKHHKEITYKYIPRADAIFFVVSSNQPPIGQMELEYLKEIRKITPFIYFVQTCSTEASTEDRENLKKNNLSLISGALDIPEAQIPYFIVDSKLRLRVKSEKDLRILNRSGFPRLMAFIKGQIQVNQQKILATNALLRMRPILNHISDLLATRRRLLDTTSKEELKKIEAEIADEQNKLTQWKEITKKEILEKLKLGGNAILADIKSELRDMCGRNSTLVRDVEDFLNRSASIENLKKSEKELKDQIRGNFAEIEHKIERSLCEKTQNLLKRLINDTISFDNPNNQLPFDNIENEYPRMIFPLPSQDSHCLHKFIKDIVPILLSVLGTATETKINDYFSSPYFYTTLILFSAYLYSFYKESLQTKRERSFQSLEETKNKALDKLYQLIDHASHKLIDTYTARYNEMIETANESIADYLNQRDKELNEAYKGVQMRIQGKADKMMDNQIKQQRRENKLARILAELAPWEALIA